MKKLFYALTLFSFTYVHAQNDIKARIEFEEAEKSFLAENYENALKHLSQAEKELGKWTPLVSYLKIESLFALTDIGNHTSATTQPLNEEVIKYMGYLNKLRSEEVPMDKYKVVYSIEKSLKGLKLEDRQNADYKKGEKEFTAKNYSEATSVFTTLALKGNTWAMRGMSMIHETKEENKEAKVWLEKAVHNGNSVAALRLTLVDSDNAKTHFEKAAQMEHPDGFRALGWYAENKDKNLTKAREYYQKAADMGSATGFYELGKMLNDKDYPKAISHYKKAAIKGHTPAMVQLGILIFEGLGIDKNPQLAMEYWLKAAEKQNVSACYYIGTIYKEGHGGYPKDYKKAEEWYLKGAKDNSNYYSLLGDLYTLADNINLQKALDYYEKCAEGGSDSAMLETANFYFTGKGGIIKDYAKAAMYYEKYYENVKKNEIYIYNLIEIYNRGGYGVEKNKEKAKYWREVRRK